jgi:hypothetical protein
VEVEGRPSAALCLATMSGMSWMAWLATAPMRRPSRCCLVIGPDGAAGRVMRDRSFWPAAERLRPPSRRTYRRFTRRDAQPPVPPSRAQRR